MKLGKLLFWLSWPLVWVYAPLVRRVRVYIVANDKVLVVKNWFGPHVWQLPGGGIKFGESVMDAAKRELQEELGFELPDTSTLLNEEPITVRQFGLIMRYHIVVCRVPKLLKLNKSKELSELSWLPEDSPSVAQEVRTARELVQMLY